ncbi:MAG: 16S rRNA (adenine(1518)-N(6)/adenine(1519)-N(6))-dimethyltransferase RsmA, partial [Clostridiales bacterium]|nr:16S rRNA (adenine(1518)-N(6)/adenine(1519)-N(6))-dimethyltransferase RsmA [Clostridiales bacterium]
MNRGDGGIREILARHGFHFSKSMGQNFLTDPNVPEKIAAAAGIFPDMHALEIGPGIGALTRHLCERAGYVTAIELDRALPPILAETLADYSNYEIVSGDALKLDIAELMRRKPEYTRFVVCANLPYNITAPVITRLLECGIFESVTVMVQREVAQRMAALPGTKAYGAFTVFVNYHAKPDILFDVPPGCFMPAPKVMSSVVRLETQPPPPEICDKSEFFRVVKAAFAQRRKTHVNALGSIGGLSKDEVTRIVTDCGIDALARGETLGVPEFASVAK